MVRPRTVHAISVLASGTLPTSCLADEYVQKNITQTPGFHLLPGVHSVPAPVSVAPDQGWYGIDGQWNTFALTVGDPQTRVSLLISTANQQIWLVNSQACLQNITNPTTGQIAQYNKYNGACGENRGFTYNQTASKTWRIKGYYQLWLEKKLGIVGNGLYGFDQVGLGLAGERGPSVQNTTIGSLVTPNFWLGNFGLHPKPTNFSAFEEPVPSFMTRIFKQKSIPSLSFGYTAGARYHGNTVLGSLTLGGYDASKIIPNDLTFIFAPDNERELVVGLAGLSANTTTLQRINLLPQDDVSLFIDSTVAELWLPLGICQAFENAFGLKYDNKTELYLVDDALHQSLLLQDPSVTFTLGQKFRTDAIVQITLPYAAFDLQASAPYRGLQQPSRYFPIRRSSDPSQGVLGRTFLQEAHLTVDWERQNFSVSAVDWTFGRPSELVAIVSPQYAEQSRPHNTHSLSTGAIIGIAIGAGFIFALLMIVLGWWFWRRRHSKKLATVKAKYEAEAAAAKVEQSDEPLVSPVAGSTGFFSKAELPGHSAVHHELESDIKHEESSAINEVDNDEPQIYEMLGDIAACQEAGGRQLSEKESMVVRARLYNGVDPHRTPAMLPTLRRPAQRLAPTLPAQVTMVKERLPSQTGVSPVTPRIPRYGAHDGEHSLGRAEDTMLSPISPLDGSADKCRRRFSYES